MPLPTAARFGLVIGAVMMALGAYVALHPLWSRAPVTTSPWLDAAFALFFLLKGWLHVRRALRPPRPLQVASASPEGDSD